MKYKKGDIVICIDGQTRRYHGDTWKLGMVLTVNSNYGEYFTVDGYICGIYANDAKLYNPTCDEFNKRCYSTPVAKRIEDFPF